MIPPDQSIQLLSSDDLTVTYGIDIDQVVDTPVEVTAQWSGSPSLSDLSHVTVTQPALHPPYSTSLTFSPFRQSNVGTYMVTVQVLSTSNGVDAVKNSSEVNVFLNLAISKGMEVLQ